METKPRRILIVGWGRSGKDAAAMILSKITRIPYAGSTSWAAKELVAEKLGLHPQEAWETRHQHRHEWKRICDELRQTEETFLIRRVFWSLPGQEGIDHWQRSGIVVGVRGQREILAAKEHRVVDYILWVDRLGIPEDPTVTFTREDCDEIILNDGTLDQLQSKLFVWAESHGLVPALYLTAPTQDRLRE